MCWLLCVTGPIQTTIKMMARTFELESEVYTAVGDSLEIYVVFMKRTAMTSPFAVV